MKHHRPVRGRVVAVLVCALALVCAGCDWRQWGSTEGHVGTNAFETSLSTDTVSALVPSTVTDTAPTAQRR
jgi:hypothetical protein